tara:strand:- start:4628 stop:6091 length:1464 start_codon:yes stop_codon:yes gene_type:complete
MKFKYIFLSVLFLGLMACETDIENPNATYPEQYYDADSGDADFSTYVSMGSNITAGVSDNTLFAAAQMNSYPNILANFMSMAGGGEFTQPYVSDNVGGINVGGQQFWGPRLYFDGAGPAQVSGSPTTEATNIEPGPYNNMAMPYAWAITYVAPGVGSLAGLATNSANPWFVRAASSDGATMLGDALMQQPTFVTFEPGNDFSSYTQFGASGFPFGPLVLDGPTGMLAGVVGSIQALSAGVPNGVITTIPDPTSTPDWNTVTHDVIPLDQGTADQINAVFDQVNLGLLVAQAFGFITADEAALRTLATRVAAGNNPILIQDETLTDLSGFGLPAIRDANENDKISLLATQFIGNPVDGTNPANGVWGVTAPLNDVGVLLPSEVNEIQTMLATANGAIAGSVPSGWALFDLAGLYNEVVTTGVFEENFNMTGDLVFGGFFSLDGFNPTSRGSALIAKRMLEAIDATWGSNLSDAGLDIGDYPTNYPNGL